MASDAPIKDPQDTGKTVDVIPAELQNIGKANGTRPSTVRLIDTCWQYASFQLTYLNIKIIVGNFIFQWSMLFTQNYSRNVFPILSFD